MTLLAASILITIKENKMVDLTRQQIHAVQAGPGEAGSHVVSIRLRKAAIKALGQQLASIGDHQYQQWTRKHANRQPTLLRLLRPTRALTRAIIRDIDSQVWEVLSSTATVKAWVLNTMTEQRGFQPQNWIHFIPVTRSGWTTGAVVAVALVALSSTLWIDWKA